MTILREAEHKALKGIPLTGKVADLGGDKRSEYRSYFTGDFTVTTVNMDPPTQPDVIADLEKPLPLEDQSFDGVLLINVLEHIFEYRALLSECNRILKPEGKIVIVVPYMMPYHPSPSDFHRFSKEALERSLASAGFRISAIKPLGSGVCSAQSLFSERLIPSSAQVLLGPITHPFVRFSDLMVTSLARFLGKKYDPADYALGFLVTATKSS